MSKITRDAETLLIYLRGCLSRIDEDKMVDVPEDYITDAIALLEAHPQPAGVRVAEHAPPRLWLSAADEDHEHQVWFDPDEGGTPYVRADLAMEPQQEEAVAWRGDGENEFGAIRKFTAIKRVAEIWADQGLTVSPLFSHPTPVQKVQESQTVSVTDEMVERFGQAFWGVNWHRGGFETIRTALTAALEPSHV